MDSHQVVICNRDAKRLAVFDTITPLAGNWVDLCADAARNYIRSNGLRYLSSHVSNGLFYAWAE